MSVTRATLLSLLAGLFVLSISAGANSTSMPSSSSSGSGTAEDPQGTLRRIFMKEADAANFFRRRSRRAVKSQDEIDAEQKQILAADERRREFHGERRNEFESYAEEDNDEQDESGRENSEQWRQFHHDGANPSSHE